MGTLGLRPSISPPRDRRRRPHCALPGPAVDAPHGGGIEPGTSELCLAIAGYHPASLAQTGGPTYDYWMLEGLLSTNPETNCPPTQSSR